MNKNGAFNISHEEAESQIRGKSNLRFNEDISSLLVDRDALREIYAKGSQRQHILTSLGGYFEHPAKGELNKQLKDTFSSQDSELNDKKLLVSLYQSKLTLRELLDSNLLRRSEMREYGPLWKVVVPLVATSISQALEEENSDKSYSEVIKNLSQGILRRRSESNKIEDLKELVFETEFFCQHMGMSHDTILDKVVLPFDKVMQGLMNKSRKTKGVLLQMEPLLGAHLETQVFDKVIAYGKQLQAYEQGVYKGDVSQLTSLIHDGFLDEQLSGLNRNEFIAFLVSLYTSSKKEVELPGPNATKLHLAIASRSLGSQARERVMKEQPKGDWDETIPFAYIDIDVHHSSPEVAKMLASYFPDKYESNNGTELEGIVRLENKELIELTDLYLTCANLQADERREDDKIEDINITEEVERIFKVSHEEQEGPAKSGDDIYRDDADNDEDDDLQGGEPASDDFFDNPEHKQKGAELVFSHYTDSVPAKLEETLRKEMGENYPKYGPYARIDKGKIFYNTKWIKEKFDIDITPNPQRESPLEAYLYNGETRSNTNTGADNFRAFSAWKEEQKRHEILHRILGFKQIKKVKVNTVDGEEIVLTQEQLCKLAETPQESKDAQVTLDGKTFLRNDIEEAIAHALPRESFSFDQIPQTDLEALEDYIENGDEAFWDQLDANAGAARVVNKGELADEPALATVLATHEATSARYTGKGGIERSTPIKIGPNKYIHERRTGGGTPISRWVEVIPNPEDRKNPYQREVTSAEMAAELAKLNNGDFDALPQQVTDGDGNNANQSNVQGNRGNKKRRERREIKDDFDFKTQFETTIDGDMNAKFSKGTLLYFKLTDSKLPGYGGTWLKSQISFVDEEAKKFTIKLVGSTEGTIGNTAGREYSVDMTEKGLNRITQRGEVRKFKEVTNGSDFYNYITQELNTDDKTIKVGKESWAGQQIKRENGKMLQKKYYKDSNPKFDTITHVGKIDKSNNKNTVLYQVTWNSDGVTVTHDNPSRSRDMDYNSFFLFAMDKGLAPFSDEQIAVAKEAKKTHQDSQRPKIAWTTLGALGQAFKNMGPLFKNAFNIEERKKIQAARLTYSMSKLFGGGVAMEALSNLDESIYSTISKFQSSLGGRESKDANDVQAEAVSRRIQREIFTPGFVLDPSMFKLKAAGYLLYSLDKGGHPYFRALNVNAHQGLWVKAILGEKHHSIFMEERQKLIDEAKSGPENQILFDKLIKFELNYIHTTVDKEEMVSVFGSQFGKKVEGFKDKFGLGDAIDGIKSSMANKNNFDDFATTFRGTLVKHTPATAIAALELMVEHAGSATQYSEVYQSIIQLFVSGLGTRSFGQEHKDRLKKIGRMAGIPVALMADDVNAPNKVLAIVDHIAARAGITKLSQFEGTNNKKVRNTDKLSVSNLTSGNGHKKSMEAIQEWRGTDRNGQTVIDAFNYKNSHLLSYEETASGETKAIIDEYFDKRVFDELADSRFGYSDKLTLGGDSPFYSNGILNISPATFSKVMLSFDNNTGQFREQGAKEMWNQFQTILSQMDTQLTNSKGVGRKFLLKLILKKFALYFGSQFDSSELADIKKSLKNNNNIGRFGDLLKGKFGTGIYTADEIDYDIDTGERYLTTKKKRGRRNVNSQVNNGLDALITLFKNHGSEINDETIRYAFGK